MVFTGLTFRGCLCPSTQGAEPAGLLVWSVGGEGLSQWTPCGALRDSYRLFRGHRPVPAQQQSKTFPFASTWQFAHLPAMVM